MKATPGPSNAIADVLGAEALGAEAPGVEAPNAASGPTISALFDAMPIGLALVDQQGRILRCNTAFIASFAIEGDPAGQVPASLLVESDRTLLTNAIAQVYAGQDDIGELRLRLLARPDEPAVVTLALSPRSMQSNRSSQSAAMIAVRDIREQLRLEAQVKQATRMQAVGQLAGGVAHDFNNVLTAVLGLCDQLLTRHLPGSSDFDDIDQIRQNANRAAALVRQLLAFARQQTLQVRRVDVADILGPLKTLLHRLVGPSVQIVSSFGHSPWAVRVDPGQLEQVIVNLAVNARDAMPDGGTLTITTHGIVADAIPALGYTIMPKVDHLEISVRDTGCGIPPGLSAKIFEPFFTTKAVGQGTGLGLSSVYGIVKQSGGFIFMEQPEGGGTLFRIYLPADGLIAREVLLPPKPVVQAALHGTVLLVEDERPVRMVVERALRHLGLTVHSVVDGGAALARLAELDGEIDLVISDVVMPGMDGVALVAAARALYPHLRIILMSGYAEPLQRRAVNRRGLFFLAKPFASAELAQAVRTALDSKAD